MPPNPSEVLGSERMRKLIDDLAEHATVIIDAPPLLPVTDGAVLTHQADGAIVVVSLGKTTYDLLEKSLDTLHEGRGPRARRRAEQGAAQGRGRVAVLVRIPPRVRHRAKDRPEATVSEDLPADSDLNALFGGPSPIPPTNHASVHGGRERTPAENGESVVDSARGWR